jgi:hypothetical protein
MPEGRAEPDELAHRLSKAWLVQAPKRLARQYFAENVG